MSKFDEKVEFYKAEMKKLGIGYKNDLLEVVTKACGPSIYKKDAETVAASDKDELERIKKSFMKGKLGLKDSDDLDGLIAHAIDKIGKSNRNKYRAIFYYILAAKSGKTPS